MKQMLWIFALCTLSSGCRLSQNLAQTLIVEPLHFAEHVSDLVEKHQYRRLANEVWNETQQQSHRFARVSDDYGQGFEDGFVDFMMAGGYGGPAPLAPRRYWKLKYQSFEGHRAIQNWFAGFEHGASVAQAGGYRDLVTLPVTMSFAHDPSFGYPTEVLPQDSIPAIEANPLPDPAFEEIPSAKRLPNVDQVSFNLRDTRDERRISAIRYRILGPSKGQKRRLPSIDEGRKHGYRNLQH